MRIRKQYQVIPTNAKLENGDSTSATNGYVAEYINDHSVVVSPTEPSGSARKKVWMKRSNNLFKENLYIDNVQIDPSGKLITDIFKVYYVKVESGKTYTMSIGSSRAWVYNFYASEPQLNSQGTTRNVVTSVNETFTVPNGYSYIGFRRYDGSGEVITNLMINEGSSILPYEPYAQDKEYILNDNDVYEAFEPQNEIYSESEIRIGTYLGKPLYRKVITGTKNHNDTLISNVSKLINSYGTGSSGYNKRTLPYYEYYNNTKYAINVYQNGSDIKTEIALGSNSSTSINVTLEYTKTTD